MDIQASLKFALDNYKYDLIIELEAKLLQNKLKLPQSLELQLKKFKKFQRGIQECCSVVEKLKSQKSSEKQGLKNTTLVQGSKIMMMNEGVLELNPFNFCVLFYQMKHYGKWMIEGIDIKQVLCPNFAQKVGKLLLQIPLTTPRYLHLHGVGFDRVQTKNQVIVFAQQIFSDSPYAKQLGQELTKADGEQQNKNSKAMFVIQKQPNGLYLFRMVVVVDVGFNLFFVPNALARYAMQNFSQGMFSNLKRLASKLQDENYQTCIKEDKHGFYKWLKVMVRPWVQE